MNEGIFVSNPIGVVGINLGETLEISLTLVSNPIGVVGIKKRLMGEYKQERFQTPSGWLESFPPLTE